MKKAPLFATLILLAIGAGAQDNLTTTNSDLSASQLQSGDLSDPADPPLLGPAWVPGSPEYQYQLQQQYRLLDPRMFWHRGLVMPQANVTAIFWGKRWNNDRYVGDKIDGLDSWYQGFGNSNYAATSNEYRGLNGQVTSNVAYAGHVIDATAATGGYNRAAILKEVCQQVNNNPDPTGNGYYPVYTDIPRPAGSIYCAYHSWGSCPGSNTWLQFAFFWSLEGPPGGGKEGCSVKHQEGELGHSLQLAALADYSAHELSEARTDPNSLLGRSGWFDVAGNENGDKCLAIYGDGPVTFSNGSQWKIQSEWSNQAYLGHNGLGFLKGCLPGQ
jgi:hypothetical protein